MLALALSLHLLGSPAPAAPAHLLPPLRLGLLTQAQLQPPPLVAPPPPPSFTPPPLLPPAPAPAAPPAQDHRLLLMGVESTAGLGALVINDGLLALADTALTFTLVIALLGSGQSSADMAVGTAVTLVVLNVLDALVVMPLVAAGAAYGASRLFGDHGGRFWRALVGAALAQAVLAGGAFVLLLVESVAFSSGSSASSSTGPALVTLTVLAAGALELVAVPLAASAGLHWGQERVPEEEPASPQLLPARPPAPVLPPAPAGPDAPPPAYPNTLLLQLLRLRFG